MAEKKTRVTILLNDGTEFTSEMPNYNAVELAEILNNNSVTMMAMGDIVVHRQTIQRITPAKE